VIAELENYVLDVYRTRFDQAELRVESSALHNGEAFVTLLAKQPTPPMRDPFQAVRVYGQGSAGFAWRGGGVSGDRV
jgi:hypothetical protein